VFSGAALHPISLTPRFSEVHSRVYYNNHFSGFFTNKTEAVGAAATSLTPAKAGWYERVG